MDIGEFYLGEPEYYVNPCYGDTYWLLQFDHGDRFVIARYTIDSELGPVLENLDNHGYISDNIHSCAQISNPNMDYISRKFYHSDDFLGG